LKEEIQRNIFDYLLLNGIENFVGVPDSTIKYFVDQGIMKKKIIIATREEEAIGIATGMSLSKSSSLIFMQNAGFANSLSTITSLVELYQIPLLFLIGWRGFLKNDAPEHAKIGKIQPQLIKSLELESRILDDENWENSCRWAIKKIRKNQCCTLVIRRDFLD
jgi:sulfopyruvate decarboxylase TPP-binding subunit